MKNHRLGALLVLTLLVITACVDRLPTTSVDPILTQNSAQLEGIPPFIDEHYVELATRIPGYGGHFFEENGTIVVYLKDLGQAESARTNLAAAMAEYRRREGIVGMNMEFRQGDYDFLELTRWRGRLPGAIGAMQGVTMIGTSKRHNRLFIGVESEAVAERVIAELRRQKIPRAAVVFEEVRLESEPPAVDDDGSSGGSTGSTSTVGTLRGRADRLQGGYQLWTQYDWMGDPALCTIGPVGRGKPGTPYAGNDYVLTASHCTRTADGVDNTIFRQPDAFHIEIGYEYQDARKYYGNQKIWPCYYGNGCRQADGALVKLHGVRGVGVGEIARPKSGSVEIDPANPAFYVVSVDRNRHHFGTVHKVGKQTGWTAGSIVHDCYDILNVPDGLGGTYTIICAAFANYASGRGDSGSPVFRYDPQKDVQVELIGIHAGRYSIGGNIYPAFVTMLAISADLELWYNGSILSDIQWTIQ